MHGLKKLGLALGVVLLLHVPARAEEHKPDPKTLLQPASPPTGASLQIYIKVRNQVLAEYCKSETLGVPACVPGALYEAKDSCAPPYKVAAVSCGLSDLGSEPRLVENGPDAKQATGSCVWAFAKLAADKVPQATTTLFCVK